MFAHQLSKTDLGILAPIRRLHSLTQADAAAATAELNRMGLSWSIDQHDDCDGDVLLILTPPSTNANTDTFVITRALGCVKLAKMNEDAFEPIEHFPSVNEAVQHLFMFMVRE